MGQRGPVMPYHCAIVEPTAAELNRTPGLVAIARRRAWIMIPCVILAAAVAFAVSSRQEKKYSSTAALLFQTSEFSASSSSSDPTTAQATNVELVSEPIISVDTARSLGGAISAGRVATEVSVAPAGPGEVVDVTATDHSPAFAAKIANAYAQQFIAYSQQSAQAQVNQAISQLEAQIHQLGSAPANASELRTLKGRLSELQGLAALQTGNVQLVEQALVPSASSSPRVRRDVALGLVAGVLVGLLAMFLAERLDGTLRDPKEVEALLALPVLAMIPSSRAFARDASRAPSEATPEAESFRLLRTQLRYFNVDREVRSLLVTSGDSGDGKSIVAWNLARTAAALSPKSRVLLIDADLRRPRIATLAGEAGSPGLSELLTHGLGIRDVVRTLRLDAAQPSHMAGQLDVITAGASPPNPSELMQSEKLRAVIREVQEWYDFVIVDAPPSAVVADAIPVMSQMSGVLLVVRLRHSQRKSLLRLREQVARLPVPCLGVIINDVRRSEHGYGGYYNRPGPVDTGMYGDRVPSLDRPADARTLP